MADTHEQPGAQRFRLLRTLFQEETLGGTLLLLAAIVAFAWANSPWADTYLELIGTPIAVSIGGWELEKSAIGWINDWLMALFFLLVAMEIKRELVIGELNGLRKAALPVLAALGGMLVPAGIYALVTVGSEASRGWGIPMATDIAFALGAMRLLGARVPAGLFAFLAALAIIDDLGAILVIAIFYSGALDWGALGSAALLVGGLVALNRFGVRRAGGYLLLGLPLWLAVHASGINPTLAGVIVGLSIPIGRRDDLSPVLPYMRRFVAALERKGGKGHADPEVVSALGEVQTGVRRVESPLMAM